MSTPEKPKAVKPAVRVYMSQLRRRIERNDPSVTPEQRAELKAYEERPNVYAHKGRRSINFQLDEEDQTLAQGPQALEYMISREEGRRVDSLVKMAMDACAMACNVAFKQLEQVTARAKVLEDAQLGTLVAMREYFLSNTEREGEILRLIREKNDGAGDTMFGELIELMREGREFKKMIDEGNDGKKKKKKSTNGHAPAADIVDRVGQAAAANADKEQPKT